MRKAPALFKNLDGKNYNFQHFFFRVVNFFRMFAVFAPNESDDV